MAAHFNFALRASVSYRRWDHPKETWRTTAVHECSFRVIFHNSTAKDDTFVTEPFRQALQTILSAQGATAWDQRDFLDIIQNALPEEIAVSFTPPPQPTEVATDTPAFLEDPESGQLITPQGLPSICMGAEETMALHHDDVFGILRDAIPPELGGSTPPSTPHRLGQSKAPEPDDPTPS